MLRAAIGRVGRNGWMGWALIAAGAYNVAWGGLVVFFPLAPFRWAGLPPPNYPEVWQCLGMVVGVYGLGYAIAATDPVRHWPIVLVGLLGKVLGPLGFLLAALGGRLPWTVGLMNLTNDLVWWVPFALILLRAARAGAGRRAISAAVSEPVSAPRSAGEHE